MKNIYFALLALSIFASACTPHAKILVLAEGKEKELQSDLLKDRNEGDTINLYDIDCSGHWEVSGSPFRRRGYAFDTFSNDAGQKLSFVTCYSIGVIKHLSK